MAVETLDDIVGELADLMGVYNTPKRCEWESNLKARIRNAIEVERMLERQLALSSSLYDLNNPNRPARCHKLRRR